MPTSLRFGFSFSPGGAKPLTGWLITSSSRVSSSLVCWSNQMAKLAAAEVVVLRTKFRKPLDVHRFFAGHLSRAGNVYRAAITAGLAGDIALARQLFIRMEILDPTKHGPQLKNLQAECATLAALLDDPIRYRSAILETIAARRQARGLPPDPQCLESLDAVI